MVTTHLLYVEERLGHEPMLSFPFLYGEIRKISRTKEIKLLKVHSSRARTHSRKQCWRIVEKGGYFSNYDQKLESAGEEEMHA